MQPRLPIGPARRETSSTDGDAIDQTTDVDRDLALWRQAVAQCGWTYEALEAEMGKDKAYIYRVLNGERAMSHAFQKALPDDVERRYHELAAIELGSIATSPALTREDALESFVRGIVGLLGLGLPARADHMATCESPRRRMVKATLRRTAGVVAIALCLAHPTAAADRPSMTVLIAASVADAVTTEVTLRSTPGAYEANPLLAGHAVRRETTKALTTGALLWGLSRIGRSRPRLAMALGWTAAGTLTAIAVHNASLSRAAR